jgi:hypothetical protein
MQDYSMFLLLGIVYKSVLVIDRKFLNLTLGPLKVEYCETMLVPEIPLL